MLSFRLLGGLALDNPERVPLGRAAQRRRLALLAVLAAPADTSVAREKLLGLLWPEVPPDEARHRLSVALYDLRRALGEDALVLRGVNVTLAPGALRCDVAEFDDAMARSDWTTAAALYRGPFLDGVYLAESPAFEQWVDERRASLQRSCTHALEHLAAHRAARGDAHGALDAWQRLACLDPYSDRFTAGLMRALDAAGERAAALRTAAAHAQRLRTELDAEPGPEVEQASAELRCTPSPVRAPALRAELPVSADAPGHAPAAAEVAPSESVATAARAPTTTAPRRPVRALGLALLPVGGLALVLAIARGTVDNAGPGGLATLLTHDAQREVEAGDAHMLAGRFDAATAAFTRAVHEDSTYALAHFRLAVATLWADRPGSDTESVLERAVARRDGLDQINGLLLDAFGAWRAGEWPRAESLARRALMIDPASIDAQHQLGEALFHYSAVQGRRITGARPYFEAVLARQPGHYGALWHLAQLAAHERRIADVDTLTSRLLAQQPDPVRTLEVSALRAAALRDPALLDTALQQLQHADESLLFGTATRLAVFVRDLDAADRVLTLLTDPARGTYARAIGLAQRVYLDIARGRTDDAWHHLVELDRMDRQFLWAPLTIALLADRSTTDPRLHALRAAAQASDSLEALTNGRPPRRALEPLVALAFAQITAGDTAAARASISALQTFAVDSAGTATAATARSRAALAQAALDLRERRFTDVIHGLDRAIVHGWFGDGLVLGMHAHVVERLLRAEALLALGQPERADEWFATVGEFAPADLVFLHEALQRRAEIAQARGDPAAAARFRRDASALRHE